MDESWGDLSKAFWEHLIGLHAAEGNYCAATKHRYRWRNLPDMRLIVAQYLSWEGDEVGVYIRGEIGVPSTTVRERLLPLSEGLQKTLRRKMGNTSYLFHTSKRFSIHDRSQWDAIADWLHKKANTYQGALQQRIGDMS